MYNQWHKKNLSPST